MLSDPYQSTSPIFLFFPLGRSRYFWPGTVMRFPFPFRPLRQSSFWILVTFADQKRYTHFDEQGTATMGRYQNYGTLHAVRLTRVTRVKKILQRSRYRGIANYYFTYHFGRKLKISFASLLRYGYPVCDIDWFNVPNTVRLNLSFFNTCGQI